MTLPWCWRMMGTVSTLSWCSTMADIPRMDDDQLREARKLIQKRCCNYDDGSCLIFDWSFCNICPQWISNSVICKWFRNAVLPNDKLLCAQILCTHDRIKQCLSCGAEFVPGSNRAKYCGKCAGQRRRSSKAAWARRKRGFA